MTTKIKYSTILLIYCFIGTFLYSQETVQVNIQGFVLDTNYHPIEFATVRLYSTENKSSLYGTISQSDGSYSIKNIQSGNYMIKISAIGYKPQNKEIDITGNKKNNPISLFKLVPDNIQLEQVEVTANAYGYSERIDKAIFKPDSQSIASSRTGLDVIRRIPDVRVDKKDRSISVLGNKNVLVLINGVDNNRSIESINPADIARIEVITHPSVKYRSDIASVVNVVLKSYKEKGITFNSNIYYCIDKKHHSGNMKLNYQLGKWNYFISYFGNLSNSLASDSTIRKDKFGNDFIYFKSLPLADNSVNLASNRLQYGFDYILNENNTISFTSRLTSYGLTSVRSKRLTTTIDEKTTGNSIINSNLASDKIDQNYSAYYLHKFRGENQKISLSTNFYLLNKNSEYAIAKKAINPSENNKATQNRLTSGIYNQYNINSKLDYTHPVSENIFFEAGNQLYFRNILNEMGATNTIASNIDYKDLRNSIYANITYNKGRKFGIQAGVRTEVVKTTVNSQHTVTPYFMPYFSVLSQLTKEHSLKLSYRKTLNYPLYSKLNPFRYYSSDSLSYSSGNPYLQPEQNNNINLKYVLRKKHTYFSSSIYGSVINDLIILKSSITDNVLALNYENADPTYQYGFNLAFSTVLFDWLEFESQVRIYHTDFSKNKINNGYSYMAEAGMVMPLWFGFDLELYGLFGENIIDYNGYSYYGGYIDEILLTKDVARNLFVGLSIWQPFITPKDVYKQWNNNYEEYNYYSEVNSTFYKINITYYFKSGKKIRKVEKEQIMESTNGDKKQRVR